MGGGVAEANKRRMELEQLSANSCAGYQAVRGPKVRLPHSPKERSGGYPVCLLHLYP